MRGLYAFAALAFGYFFACSDRRRRYLAVLLAFLPSAALIAANMHFFNDMGHVANYVDIIRQVHRAVPPFVVFYSYLPFIFCSGYALATAYSDDKRRFAVYCVVIGTSAALINNDILGYNNEPCRFIPYSYPLVSILTAMGLWELFQAVRNAIGARRLILSTALAVSAGLLLLGVWANIEIYRSFAFSTTKPVDPRIQQLAAVLERRCTHVGGKLVLVDCAYTNGILDAREVAAYTAASLMDDSVNNFSASHEYIRRIIIILLRRNDLTDALYVARTHNVGYLACSYSIASPDFEQINQIPGADIVLYRIAPARPPGR
ncbi:MAG: hypothetical protein P4L33_11190 [Capsulimonadaceae bacterium]|nr:hypothetical protein [Capsulimonadaceae bacterium]